MDDMDFEKYANDQEELNKIRQKERELKEKLAQYESDASFQRVQAVTKQVNELLDEGVLTKEQLAKIMGVEIKTKKPNSGPKYFINPLYPDKVIKTGNFGVTKAGIAIREEWQKKNKEYDVKWLQSDEEGKLVNPEKFNEIKEFFDKNKTSANVVIEASKKKEKKQ